MAASDDGRHEEGEIDELRRLNPPGPRGRSLLEVALARGDIEPKPLCRFSRRQDDVGSPRAAVFFRLPGVVVLGDRSYVCDGSTDRVRLEVFAFPQRFEHREDGTVEVTTIGQGDTERDGPAFTQFAVLVPLIGARNDHHARWAGAIDWDPEAEGVLVPAANSWSRDGAPITMQAFAENVGLRCRKEVRSVLTYFLNAYSIAALARAPPSDWLYNFLTLVPPGRLARGAEYRSVLGRATSRVPRAALAAVEPARMEAALRTRSRVINPFEQKLIALAQVNEDGEPALALMGALALLEWLLKRELRAKGRTRLVDLIDEFRFEADTRARLHALRDERNQVAHENPELSLPDDLRQFNT